MAQILLKNLTTGQRVYADDSSPDYQAYMRGGFVVDKPADTTTNDKDALTDDQKKFYDEWAKKIDAMDITSGQKATLKEVLKGDYKSGVLIPSNTDIAQIIQDAAKNAAVDLSPYYATMTQRETEDIQADLSNIREKAANYEKQEAMGYAQKLAAAKQTLRASGRTFSGTSLKLLGNQSAVKNTTGIEGTMPEDRRLGYEAQVQSWQEAARNQAQPAERLLGSSVMSGMNYNISTPYGTSRLYNPLGNVGISDIELQRQAEIEKSKWGRVNAQRPWI